MVKRTSSGDRWLILLAVLLFVFVIFFNSWYSFLRLPPPIGFADIAILAGRLTLFAIGASLLSVFAFRQARRTPRLFVPLPKSTASWDVDEALGAIRRFRQRVDSKMKADGPTLAESWDFAHRMLRVSEYRGRVVEQIDLSDRLASKRLKLTVLRYPNSDHPGAQALATRGSGSHESKMVIVPLVRFRRGVLISNLEVRDANGGRMPSLSHDEVAVYVGCCATRLLYSAVEGGVDSLDSEQTGALVRILDIVDAACVRSRPNLEEVEEFSARAHTYASAIGEILKRVPSLKLDAVALQWLTEFMAMVEVNYAIVVGVDFGVSDRAAITCQHVVDMPLEGTATPLGPLRSRVQKAQDSARSLLGVETRSLYLDASRARKCPSYHLEVNAPSNSYVAESIFYDVKQIKAIERLHIRGMYNDQVAYFRCPPANGGEHAHLYTRGFKNHPSLQPGLYVRFVEKPPGSLGRAWIMALAVLMIVWFFGMAETAKAGNLTDNALAGIDPAALLLAIPVALWAWMGMTDRNQGSPTLVAQVSLALSTFHALAALLTLQMISGGRLPSEWRLPPVATVSHAGWILLLSLAFLNATWTGVVMLLRWARWRRLKTAVNLKGAAE